MMNDEQLAQKKAHQYEDLALWMLLRGLFPSAGWRISEVYEEGRLLPRLVVVTPSGSPVDATLLRQHSAIKWRQKFGPWPVSIK